MVHIMTNDQITIRVKVNRNRTQRETLVATGRARYTDLDVVDAMPKGEGDEVEVVFFKSDPSTRYSWDETVKDFESRGLKPADPVSVATVNEAYPAFADEKPHNTYWKDAKGKWCYAAFYRWDGERRVSVNHGSNGRSDNRWWSAGIRLPAMPTHAE